MIGNNMISTMVPRDIWDNIEEHNIETKLMLPVKQKVIDHRKLKRSHTERS